MVCYHRKKRTKWPPKYSFSRITWAIFTQIRIGRKVYLGNSKSYPNPVSELCSDVCPPQEKANKYFRLFANKPRARRKIKNRIPYGTAPGDRAFAGTFGFRNNHQGAEKSAPKCRRKLWKIARGLTICLEIFIIRGWDPILLECGGTSSWARGVTLAARWLYETQPITSGWSWAFPIGRGGIEWGDQFFRAQVVGGVEIWRCLRSRDGTLSSPGAVGPRRCPEGKLSQRAVFMSPSQSTINGWGWGLHTIRGGINPGDHCFRPRIVGVLNEWKDL